MNQADLLQLLTAVKAGAIDISEATDRLTRRHDGPHPETADLVLDTDRHERIGFPEAIYGAGKTPDQVVRAFGGLLHENGRALATRCSAEIVAAVRVAFADVQVHDLARVCWLHRTPPVALGRVAVLAAGTSDLPVAEEAALTAEFAGAVIERIYDVGVAGIHRLLGRLKGIREADVAIVVAGMEGALPSVVGGLVGIPLIAVPTSVGYGASFAGLTALLAMLNSCAAGIPVVNIDNGFGAAVAAVRILQRRSA